MALCCMAARPDRCAWRAPACRVSSPDTHQHVYIGTRAGWRHLSAVADPARGVFCRAAALARGGQARQRRVKMPTALLLRGAGGGTETAHLRNHRTASSTRSNSTVVSLQGPQGHWMVWARTALGREAKSPARSSGSQATATMALTEGWAARRAASRPPVATHTRTPYFSPSSTNCLTTHSPHRRQFAGSSTTFRSQVDRWRHREKRTSISSGLQRARRRRTAQLFSAMRVRLITRRRAIQPPPARPLLAARNRSGNRLRSSCIFRPASVRGCEPPL